MTPTPRFHPSQPLAVLILLVSVVFLSACDISSDDTDSGATSGRSQLVGSYDLVSIRDITGDITSQPDRTLLAGVPNPVTVNFGSGQPVTVTFVVVGSVVFTSTAYSFDITIQTQFDGSNETVTDNATGTWAAQGTELVLNDSAEPTDEVVSWSLVQGRLTLSNAETVLVFQRR
ncbi:MAG: hypothetical protein RIE53_08150 [Rhodothermales bacterium]